MQSLGDTSRDDALLGMEKWAEENEFPIIGPLVGRFLYQITKIAGAKKVLELGSGFGYSAYWFAKAIGDSGRVYITEYSSDNIKLANEFLTRMGVRERVDVYEGDALFFLECAEERFDIIFNDIDKELYPSVVDESYRILQKGGLLITDNLLWSGRVLTSDKSESSEGIREFTRLIMSHEGFYTTIIPIRDGVSVSIKL